MSVASLAVRGLAAGLGRMRFSSATAWGRRLGRLAFRLDRRHREVALANLSGAFPERSDAWRRDVARGSFEQAGRTALEMLWSSRLGPERLAEIVDLRSLERLRAHTDSERGAILATGHYGNWELLGVALGLLGVPLISVARPLDDADLDRVVTGIRTRTGSEIVPKERALRPVLRALTSGKHVAMLMDQNTQRHEAVFVPFFGRLAATPPGAAHLHLRTGAPVLPAFAVPTDGGYELRIEEPVTTSAGDRDVAVRELIGGVTARLEAQIRRRPEPWLWMHDRWRERPREDPPEATS